MVTSRARPRIRRLRSRRRGWRLTEALACPTLRSMNQRSQRVTIERQGHILAIGINRPEKRNAFDLAMIDALAAAYEELGDDPEIRCGLLFAHGDHFSAGLDLAEVGPVVAEKGPAALGGSRKYDPFGMWA